MNAVAERFVLSVKHECLDRLILFGARQLKHAVDQYAAHYNAEVGPAGLEP